ncbi:hypothetical protein DPMN_112258 [Dreissena polymorpha]|nr:hypothetical protein DPMN_112258 [Dreissena polymorpha]
MVLVALLFSIILLVLPREDSLASSTKIYDYSVIYRSLLIAGCALFLLIGLFAFLFTHAMMPIYAKPLRPMKLS